MRRMSSPESGRNEGVLGRARRGGRAQNSAYLSSARIERGFRSVYRGVSRKNFSPLFEIDSFQNRIWLKRVSIVPEQFGCFALNLRSKPLVWG